MVAVKVAVGACAVATTTDISLNATLSFSLLSTMAFAESTMATARCGPSCVKVTGIVSSASPFGGSTTVVSALNPLPLGNRIVTWNTGAGALPLLSTLTINGTVDSF